MSRNLGLGISLGVDFGSLDRDLRKVAARIETTGQDATLKLAPEIATGGMDADKLAATAGLVGARLASGISEGTGKSQALMLSFAGHVNTMVDRLAGTTVEMFRRVDASMKFARTDNAFKQVKGALWSLGTTWSSLDLFGKVRAAFAGGGEYAVRETRKAYDPAKALVDAWGSLRTKVAAARAEMATAATAPGPMGRDRTHATGGVRVAGVGRQIPLAGPTELTPLVRAGVAVANAIDRVKAAAATLAPAFDAVAAAGRFGLKAVASVADAATLALMAPVRVLGLLGAGVTAAARQHWLLKGVLSSLGDVGGKTFRSLYEQTGLLHRAFVSLPVAAARLGTRLLALPFHVFRHGESSSKSFGKGVKSAEGPVTQLRGAIRGVGQDLLMAFGAFGLAYKAVEFFKDGVKGASDLNETVNRTQTVFGDSFGKVDAQASKMTAAFGLSHQAQLDVASGFGAMATGAGMSESAAADLANQMTKMAANLSSSVNIGFEEAGDKIRSALAGQSEPLRQYGADISDAAVKAYALSHGIAAAGGELTNQQKITARAALIMRGLAYAQGDLERTSGSAANQFRKAGGGMQEFATQIGKVFLPVTAQIATGFNDVLGVVLEFFEGHQDAIAAWGETIATVASQAWSVLTQLATVVTSELGSAFSGSISLVASWGSTLLGWITGAVKSVGIIARNFDAVWQIVKLSAQQAMENVFAILRTLPENFGRVTSWLGRNWYNLFRDIGNFFVSFATNLLHNAKVLGQGIWDYIQGKQVSWDFTSLLKGFEATTEQLPEFLAPAWADYSKELGEQWDKILKSEAGRMPEIKATPVTVAVKKPGPVEDMAKASEYKLASAVEIGSKEAYSTVARGLAGGQSTTSAVKQNVMATKEVAAGVKELVAVTKSQKSDVFDPSGAGFAIK